MARRRIAWAALLGLAVLFQIFFRFYLSTFTLALVVLLPVLSVLLSLPGALGCALALAPDAPAATQGEGAVRFRLALKARGGLPPVLPRVRAVWTNQLTGEAGRVCLPLGGAAGTAAVEAPAPHCGRLVCRVERAWACDLLGLFPLPLRKPAPASVLILPRRVELETPPGLLNGPGDGVVLRPRPGGGPGEDYDLRDYRPGDPLRAVHWKLSAKRDGLVVKEVLEPRRAVLVLTYDHFGPPEALDRTFARLCALSRWLLDHQRPHHIRWAGPAGGAEGGWVDGEEALLACLARAFSTPAPAEGPSILDRPLEVAGEGAGVRRIHVTPDGLKGGGL